MLGDIPSPQYHAEAVPDMSGTFAARMPKTIHAKLATRARKEGVSLKHPRPP